jgi:hypothetical protein
VSNQTLAPIPGPHFHDVQVIEGDDAAFNLDVRRNRLAYLVGEVVIDGQMVVDSPEVTIPIEHVAFGCWLFHQALHESGFTRNSSYCDRMMPVRSSTEVDRRLALGRATSHRPRNFAQGC